MYYVIVINDNCYICSTILKVDLDLGLDLDSISTVKVEINEPYTGGRSR